MMTLHNIHIGHGVASIVLIASLTLLMMFAFPATAQSAEKKTPFTIVLGVAQDAGYPQAGCMKPCCAGIWDDPSKHRFAASLAIVDPETNERWIIDATPDFKDQLYLLDKISSEAARGKISGILLTHAHIGHYTGLMHLGREVMGTKGIPVYAMPKMKQFLSSNGPWDQLVTLKNIELRSLKDMEKIRLNQRIAVTPFLIPHRNEYAETVGFHIEGPEKSVIFIPDINKWERWEKPIEDKIAMCDVAYLDGTFFENGEIPGRDMSKIPHPFISESLTRFKPLPEKEKSKIRFIHLNHTNPALIPDSPAQKKISTLGFGLAKQSERVNL